MDKKKIAALLNQDLEMEHGAIIQYLNHAYAIGEGEVACEIEAIAREEMRHFDYLAEKIVELGGEVSLTRGKTNLSGKTPPVWMKNDVIAEEEAIAMYKEHIRLIDDPIIKQLLQRILSDEEVHRGEFTHYIDKVRKEKLKDVRGTSINKTATSLNWGIEHEYTVILQYMVQSYYLKNRKAQNELQDQAVNEMQHMGWLAEELVDAKGSPHLEHTEIVATGKTVKIEEMLKADITVEDMVAKRYEQLVKETRKPSVKKLITRLRDHEIYHSKVFGEILESNKK
jgi:bacterioferritin